MGKSNFLKISITCVSLVVACWALVEGAGKKVDKGKLVIGNMGTEDVIDYKKYGSFKGSGTDKYSYEITDLKGLKKAAGTGIYPDVGSVYKDKAYKRLKKKGKLKGDYWDFIYSDNDAANFYKWASKDDSKIPGVKQWFTALVLERAGFIKQAIKAYYAIIVHFPNTMDWTDFDTPWYQGRAAVDKVDALCRLNPEFGMKLVGCEIRINNGYNNEIEDDVFYIRPGKIVKCDPDEVVAKRVDIKTLSAMRTVGGPDIKLTEYNNSQWQLTVDGKPFMVKAVAYSPNKIGLTPDQGNLTAHKDYQLDDYNENGKIDGPYDAWVDKNGNNKQDDDEPAVGDFKLMQDMGVNAVRLYHHSYNKELLRDMYKTYGIRVLMGDYLGMYAVGSGAPFASGTDYSNKEDRRNMMESVKEMVMDNKDEDYLLMWVLGNENNYGVACNAGDDPVPYYKFVNEVAKMIKKLDSKHPIVLCNGDFLYLDLFGKYCPDVDVYGTNSYRGKDGFGISMWKGVKGLSGKPVLITEYGCPAYRSGKDTEIAQADQAEYHELSWKDIMYNSIGSGQGNSIGGVVFEWCDEWWKDGNSYEADKHGTKGQFKGAFPDGWLYEEWLGICGQGNGENSPFQRNIRKVYYTYQKLWKE